MWECRTIAREPMPAASFASRPGASGSPPGSGTADGEEVERVVEPGVAQGEVRGGDRRHEAAVEGVGDPQHPVNAVPAEAERELVRAQLAGVEQAEDRDVGEVGLEQLL